MRTLAAALLLALVAQLAACGKGQPLGNCADNDRACAQQAMRDHPARKLDYWIPVLSKPIAERIGPALPELVDYIRLDNIGNGFPNRPRAATVSPEFLRDVYVAINGMPDVVVRKLGTKLVGIYFVEDLGGTGFTEQIYDASHKPVAGFVVLDAAVLGQRTANAWASWKESSPFKARAGYSLQAEIEGARDDDRKNAIQYILLHEFGHLLAIDGNLHPSWDIQPREVGRDDHYPFFDSSWTTSWADNRYYTLFDASFPNRSNVIFYFGARLDANQMLDTYEHLERTNFATLYSVNNPSDDFAEAFANYVHVVMMRRPFTITLYDNGKPSLVYRDCWAEVRCAAKRRIIEQFLKGESA